MAYTIVKSDGTVLTTIADGTINTTSTTLGLPGRNFAGYGQPQDTNFVHLTENFAAATPPANPLRGQIWYDIGNSALRVCPADGQANSSAWLTLTSTAGGGSTNFGAVSVTGNLQSNNLSATNSIVGSSLSVTNATVANVANINLANIITANIGTTNTKLITTGSPATAGSLIGTWTANGGISGNAFIVTGGNIFAGGTSGIKTDNYMYANGVAFVPSGTYTNANVFDYMTGANAVSQFTGNIAPAKITTSNIAGGGNISGIWTLSAGARLNATYADLAERFAADAEYAPGTVVEIGGVAEVTMVVDDLSEKVFGVVSNTAAYLMNNGAGNDATHPPIALSGRVTVNVDGKVEKGDRLVSAGQGRARAATVGEATAFNTIGRALVDKLDDSAGTVEAIVNIK